MSIFGNAISEGVKEGVESGLRRGLDEFVRKAVRAGADAGRASAAAELAALHAENKRLAFVKDEAYFERNRLVAFLSRLYPSGIARTDIPGWDPEWHGCVYIDTPAGQMSWHYHDRDAWLFEDLPPASVEWDGHSTDEKYERLWRLTMDANPLPIPSE